ncbi:MAG TPA: hypothetical protein VG122_01060 [Gemmata sp.]|nr:hypothetical protein [Gemmata sp.]
MPWKTEGKELPPRPPGAMIAAVTNPQRLALPIGESSGQSVAVYSTLLSPLSSEMELSGLNGILARGVTY